MSFINGFEKTAGPILGALHGYGQRFAKMLTPSPGSKLKSTVGAIDAQSAARAGRKGTVGGTLVNRDISKFKASNPSATAEQMGEAASTSQALRQKEVMNRFNRKQNSGKNWFQRNPIKSTIGGFIGARALLKDDQPPQPPPQVVQY